MIYRTHLQRQDSRFGWGVDGRPRYNQTLQNEILHLLQRVFDIKEFVGKAYRFTYASWMYRTIIDKSLHQQLCMFKYGGTVFLTWERWNDDVKIAVPSGDAPI